MRFKSLLLPLVAVLASSAVARRPHQKRTDGDGTTALPHGEEKAVVVPGRYIVEFASVSLASKSHYIYCVAP
jgi:hypothetical protein